MVSARSKHTEWHLFLIRVIYEDNFEHHCCDTAAQTHRPERWSVELFDQRNRTSCRAFFGTISKENEHKNSSHGRKEYIKIPDSLRGHILFAERSANTLQWYYQIFFVSKSTVLKFYLWRSSAEVLLGRSCFGFKTTLQSAGEWTYNRHSGMKNCMHGIYLPWHSEDCPTFDSSGHQGSFCCL